MIENAADLFKIEKIERSNDYYFAKQSLSTFFRSSLKLELSKFSHRLVLDVRTRECSYVLENMTETAKKSERSEDQKKIDKAFLVSYWLQYLIAFLYLDAIK